MRRLLKLVLATSATTLPIVIRLNEVVFHFQLFVASAHKVNSRLRLPLGLLIAIIRERVKKIFSIV